MEGGVYDDFGEYYGEEGEYSEEEYSEEGDFAAEETLSGNGADEE